MLRWACGICGCQGIAKSIAWCPQCGAHHTEPARETPQRQPQLPPGGRWWSWRTCTYPGCRIELHYWPYEGGGPA